MNKFPERYFYPAVFHYDEHGIAVEFPDLPGCVTCADTQDEALELAQDALAGFLSCLEMDNDPIPAPSVLTSIKTEYNEAAVLVEAWMRPLREQTVRKNLTVPSYLAYEAEKAGVNFSQVLTAALEKLLHPDEDAEKTDASSTAA